MEALLRFIDINLIFCLPGMILTLILVERIRPDIYPTRNALQVMRWIIVGYTLIVLVHLIWGIFQENNWTTFSERISGPYDYTFTFMALNSLILPFTLLPPRLARSSWYVMFVALGMKAGAYFEKWVIFMTSLHRDYPNTGVQETLFLAFKVIALTMIQGVLFTLLLLGIMKWASRWFRN